MAKSYRNIQQWDHWLTQFLGSNVLQIEQQYLPKYLNNCNGKHALLIGVPRQNVLFKSNKILNHYALTPLSDRLNRIRCIESKFNELPIASSSMDLVLLPHTLDMCDRPEQLLNEVCRIVKPEGHVVILGFNPFSFWGLMQRFLKNSTVPWSFKFLKSSIVINWLENTNFELQKKGGFLFQPPIQNETIFKKLRFLEWIGQKFFPSLGGVYVLVAKAKVIPLTPIKLKWKQTLPAVQIIPRPTMRGWL